MDWELTSIAEIKDMGDGTRVEIDFIDILRENEGVLVGDTSKGYVCVLAEVRETETYPPRPFRVNVGAIHQYIYVGNNETKYLSEIQPGDKICVTDGNSERMVTVGRVKMESRPFIRLQLENGISTTLQNADSVFIRGENKALHLVETKPQVSVLCVKSDVLARHKGKATIEDIEEK